ncbi:potassium channel family protein [Clostridium felsineum]|uniref:Uncharacterized protein n=1 Tax=Clostridium felsineum TaxID=36839 RepID=A0A1S8LFZ3_9CLOT|nr:potassium channel family protein [Clostridium felsineum]MCR3760604.1 potassium channel family protein [Clostridium felsineum]URZ00474.1 hypothetical protein CLAUR_004620 [Clostridium felsineum]URZ06887.1 hypothetical protein CLROS_022200 [Clostridium felsineum]URZ11919.1 hypothetical protein CROST_026360 [Clostridium felsineum]
MHARNYKEIIYNVNSFILSLTISVILIIELSFKLSTEVERIFNIIDNIVLIIFTIDYFTRLFLSRNKKKFFKENILDLISIIPFNSIFQGFRILRISRFLKLTQLFKFLKLFRLFSFLLKSKKHFTKFVKTNNFQYALYTTVFVLILGTIGIHFIEGLSYNNALWWSFVTITTVGYGDISPSTTLGRILASILMLVGIGFLSMLTGTISTFFLRKKTNTSYENSVLNDIKYKLDNFDELTSEDIDNIYKILKALKMPTL